MKLLLASNSGEPYYEWLEDELVNFVDDQPVTFISAATVYNPDEYFKKVEAKLGSLGIRAAHLKLDSESEELISKTKVFLVGGGNTYNLLHRLLEPNLVDKIRSKVRAGAKYIGISAGANIVGPTILTTNDWNVAGTKQFDGLNLVPFNINPHYIDPHDKTVFSGESRDDRISEYFVMNSSPVIAMEEKTMMIIENGEIKVAGYGKVKLFKKNIGSKIFKAGEKIKLSGL